MVENIFHYTSIENLLLILKTKSICFNSLENVDDMEEKETEDSFNSVVDNYRKDGYACE